MTWILSPGEVSVLGIGGPARSGKDHMALIAARYGFLPIPLANHFKISVLATGYLADGSRFMPDVRQLWETDKDEEHRDAFQQEGTEWGRDVYGDDVWCRHAEAWMYYFALKGFRRFVLPDIRFQNEAEWIHGLGGKVCLLHGRGGLQDPKTGAHRSEQEFGLLRPDLIIDNSPEHGPEAERIFEDVIIEFLMRGPR